MKLLLTLLLGGIGAWSFTRTMLSVAWYFAAEWVIGDALFWPHLTTGDLDSDGWLLSDAA